LWRESTHAKRVDLAVNDIIQILTGCLKPTPIDLSINSKWHMVPPGIRKGVVAAVKRNKAE